jgi:hypothetical protein
MKRPCTWTRLACETCKPPQEPAGVLMQGMHETYWP